MALYQGTLGLTGTRDIWNRRDTEGDIRCSHAPFWADPLAHLVDTDSAIQPSLWTPKWIRLRCCVHPGAVYLITI